MLTTRPSAGDDQHRSAQHRRRVVDAVERLDDDPRADGEDGDAVGVGDERLDPVEAVGQARGRLPVGEVEGVPGEAERDRIRQHVAGVGQQRQRSGVEAASGFGDHEAAGQEGCDQDALLVGAAMHMTGTMAVAGMTATAWSCATHGRARHDRRSWPWSPCPEEAATKNLACNGITFHANDLRKSSRRRFCLPSLSKLPGSSQPS